MTLMDERLANLHRLGGQRFVREMIDLFLDNAPKQLASARTGLSVGDLVVVHRAVHSLKSSAANFGAQTLQDLAARAEQLAAARQAEPLPGLLSELEAAFTETRTTLEGKRGQG